jgi:hypothetical protein
LGRLCCGELPDFSGDRGKQEEARSQTNVTGRFVAISTKNVLKMLAHVPAKQSKCLWKSSFNSCASGVSKKWLILGPTRLLDTMNFQVSVAWISQLSHQNRQNYTSTQKTVIQCNPQKIEQFTIIHPYFKGLLLLLYLSIWGIENMLLQWIPVDSSGSAADQLMTSPRYDRRLLWWRPSLSQWSACRSGTVTAPPRDPLDPVTSQFFKKSSDSKTASSLLSKTRFYIENIRKYQH